MDICECMATQNASGDSVCRRCRGDIYACECPLEHSIRCRLHPDNECDFCHKGMRSSESTNLCIQCKAEFSANIEVKGPELVWTRHVSPNHVGRGISCQYCGERTPVAGSVCPVNVPDQVISG